MTRRPVARRRTPPGTGISAACAVTPCSSLTGLAASNAVHSADGRENVLKPVLARYADRELMRFFRTDAAFAVPELYEDAGGGRLFLRHPGLGRPLFRKAGLRLCSSAPRVARRPMCGASAATSRIGAASRDKPRRVVANVERHPGDLFSKIGFPKIGFPKIGFVVTKLPMEPDRIIRFYNQRSTAERHIEEGRKAINRTRLSCKGMARNEVRLQLHASACNPGVLLQGADLPEEMAGRSPTGLRPSNGSVRQRYRHDGVGDQTRAKAARRV